MDDSDFQNVKENGIGDHMNTSELEAIAICYDNIRSLRKKMP